MKLNYVYLLILIQLFQSTLTKRNHSKLRLLSKINSKHFVRDLRYAKPPQKIGEFIIGRFKKNNRGLTMKSSNYHKFDKIQARNHKSVNMKKKLNFSRVPRYLKKTHANPQTNNNEKRKLSHVSPEVQAQINQLKNEREQIDSEISSLLHKSQKDFVTKNANDVFSSLGIDCDMDKKISLLGAGALAAGTIMGNKQRKKLRHKKTNAFNKIMMNEMIINQISKEINALSDVVAKMTAAGTKASRVEYDLTFLIQRKIGNTLT